jgi:hypothetical protein
MAIEMNIERGQLGVKYPYPKAYGKIEEVIIHTGAKDQVWIEWAIFGDQASRQESGSETIEKVRYTTTWSKFIEKAGGPPTASAEGFLDALKECAYRYLKGIGITGKNV